MLTEGYEAGAFHFELMTAFIYQVLPFKGLYQALGLYGGILGYILATAAGMLRNQIKDLANINDSILTEPKEVKTSAMLVKSVLARVKLQDFSRRMSVMPQNERPGRIASVQRMGVLV